MAHLNLGIKKAYKISTLLKMSNMRDTAIKRCLHHLKRGNAGGTVWVLWLS